MASLKSLLRKSGNSLSANKLMKNDIFTNIVLVILVILTFNYLNTRQYQATIFMYIVAVAGYYICKSLSCGLLISIVLTNLLISMNYFNISENLENGSNKEKSKKKDKKEKEKEKEKSAMPDLNEAMKQLEKLGLNNNK